MKKSGQDQFKQTKGAKVRIKIETKKCISAATCIVQAPKTFELDGDGIAYVKESDWDEALQIIEAAKACPTMAVIVEDLSGNLLWPEKK